MLRTKSLLLADPKLSLFQSDRSEGETRGAGRQCRDRSVVYMGQNQESDKRPCTGWGVTLCRSEVTKVGMNPESSLSHTATHFCTIHQDTIKDER